VTGKVTQDGHAYQVALSRWARKDREWGVGGTEHGLEKEFCKIFCLIQEILKC
jgi:hypothetical protein